MEPSGTGRNVVWVGSSIDQPTPTHRSMISQVHKTSEYARVLPRVTAPRPIKEMAVRCGVRFSRAAFSATELRGLLPRTPIMSATSVAASSRDTVFIAVAVSSSSVPINIVVVMAMAGRLAA